ncbi:GIY-YIG nuclease family protein [Halioxenophilus aromaticivorans]|uniref:GIY-YIG nuclease family protein n=1 Tax=Halioxenophilus aromaticivorans TaxID=1306992 RepID=A0AAV3TX85_9ALTE
MVYIIETTKGKLYTGITNNLPRRTQQHHVGRGAKYFRIDPPKHLLWHEPNHTKVTAARREIEIKKLTRQQKLFIIQSAKQQRLPIPISPPAS